MKKSRILDQLDARASLYYQWSKTSERTDGPRFFLLKLLKLTFSIFTSNGCGERREAKERLNQWLFWLNGNEFRSIYNNLYPIAISHIPYHHLTKWNEKKKKNIWKKVDNYGTCRKTCTQHTHSIQHKFKWTYLTCSHTFHSSLMALVQWSIFSSIHHFIPFH